MYSKHILVIASCVLACTFARPSDIPPEKLQPTVIPIVSQSEELEPNGTYKFSYETGNGIKREETAYEKILPKSREASSNEGGENSDESDEIHVQQGSYSYTAPDGTVITLRYIADENGFQPIGDHLPRSPVVPSSTSAEKSGRALKTADSSESASAPVEAKTVKKPTESVPSIPEEEVKSAPAPEAEEPKTPASEEPKSPSTEAPSTAQSATESEANSATTANVDVSTEAASTAAPAQPSTEPEQASTASAEQASTSTPEQSVSAEVTEQSSSTSAPEQSSSSETLGQSTATEAVNQSTTKEAEQPSTNAPQPSSGEESSSTTISA